MPGLISFTGVIRIWGLLSHAQNVVRQLALSKRSVSFLKASSLYAAVLCAAVLCAAVLCAVVFCAIAFHSKTIYSDHNLYVLSVCKHGMGLHYGKSLVHVC